MKKLKELVSKIKLISLSLHNQSLKVKIDVIITSYLDLLFRNFNCFQIDLVSIIRVSEICLPVINDHDSLISCIQFVNIKIHINI